MRIINPNYEDYWNDLKSQDNLNFLDIAQIDKIVKYKNEISKFYYYAILAELVTSKKLSY